MKTIDTIRYMGVKTKLLEYIIPEIQKITPSTGIVLDIMAGSNAVAYALKEHFTVYTNDIQYYSYVISKAIIVNQHDTISSKSAHTDLLTNYQLNKSKKYYNYFENTYSGTYFSKEQCSDIDSIRYAIDKIINTNTKNLYLFALMCAMCKVQSTPGHFAQYMPSTHKRIIPLQKLNLFEIFLEKCDSYIELMTTNKQNKAFNMDFHELLKCDYMNNVNTIYLDSPYTQEQYSRFYHILETVTKYDSPSVHFKAKYRENRFQSSFCYKSKVATEFESIFSFCKDKNINLVISYSNKGLIAISDLENIAKSYFSNIETHNLEYKHSTQGKGSNKITEVIIVCTN